MVKTKALIICEVTTQLICSFVFSYEIGRFYHDVAHSHEFDLFLIKRPVDLIESLLIIWCKLSSFLSRNMDTLQNSGV